MAITLSHDAFARQSTVRRVAMDYRPNGCDWCGTKKPRLFCYDTEPDDSSRTNWHTGAFCNRSCHDAYHGV
jgi:hypothetical protein